MEPEIWVLVAAVIIGLQGAAHLVMLHLTPQLRPTDPALVASLRAGQVPLSDETDAWRLWMGFSTSHALGALVFAGTYGGLAVTHPEVVLESWWLAVVGLGYLLGMLVTSLRCWFRLPSVGIGVAALAFVIGVMAGHLG